MSGQFSSKTPSRTGVVLVHGLTGTPVEMKPLEKHLRKLGFDVENVLLAGHGGHHREILAVTWLQWLDNVRDGVKKMLERNEKVIICGLSMGAILASAIAAEESRVCGLVLMSPTWAYDGSVMLNKAFDACVKVPVVQNTVRKLVGWFPILGEKIFWEETPPYGLRDERLQRQITKSIEEARKGGSNEFGTFRTYYGPLWHMWALVDHTRPLLDKIRCPVMMVSSLEDTIASINNATITYLEIASKNKALFFLTGCDHVMTLDLQKQQLFKLIGKFIDEYGRENSNKPVIETLSPLLYREKPDTKGGALTMTVSPSVCGLSSKEWASLYSDLNFNTTMRNNDAREMHSLVARENGSVLVHIPMSVSSIEVHVKKFGKLSALAGMSTAGTMVAMGQQNRGCPPIGVTSQCDYSLYVRAWSYALEIFAAIGKNRQADWYAYQGLSRKAYLQLQLKQTLESRLDRLDSLSTVPLYRHRNAFLSRLVRMTPGVFSPIPLVEPQTGSQRADEMLSAT